MHLDQVWDAIHDQVTATVNDADHPVHQYMQGAGNRDRNEAFIRYQRGESLEGLAREIVKWHT